VSRSSWRPEGARIEAAAELAETAESDPAQRPIEEKRVRARISSRSDSESRSFNACLERTRRKDRDQRAKRVGLGSLRVVMTFCPSPNGKLAVSDGYATVRRWFPAQGSPCLLCDLTSVQQNGCSVAFFWIGALRTQPLTQVSNTDSCRVMLHFRAHRNHGSPMCPVKIPAGAWTRRSWLLTRLCARARSA